jgi:hypothetical protein
MQLPAILVLLTAALAAATPFQRRAPKTAEPKVFDVQIVTHQPAGTSSSPPLPVPNNTTSTNSTLDAREIEKRGYAWINWYYPYSFHISTEGNSFVQMWSSGAVQFKTHFRATGFWSYDYAISCGLRDAGGRVYTLSRKGRIHGTWEPGSRNSDVDETRIFPDVQAHFIDIWNSDRNLHCTVHMENSISWDRVKSLVSDIINLIKQYGPYVATVIALF